MSWKNFDSNWDNEYYFEPKQSPPNETKSMQLPGGGTSSIVGMLQDVDRWDMSFRLLNEYYKRCAPFADAVNKIADSGCEIPPRLYNIKTNEYVPDHPILDLLAFPNDRMTGTDFMRALISQYAITGNPFVRSLGPVRRPPVALKIDRPEFAQMEADSVGGVKDIKISNDFGVRTYNAVSEDGRRRHRRGEEDEIWHVFSFNPDDGTRKFFGAPIARPLYYDLELYIYGGKHNKTLLKRGARPSGAVTIKPEDMVTDDDFEALQRQIATELQGVDNAGKVLLLQWGEFKQMSQTNKDMEYKDLIERAAIAPYLHYNIPLPLINSDSMTYDNFAAAQVALYDRATMPMVRFLFEQIWAALMYRFDKNWRDYRIVINEHDIPALITRRIENTKMLSETKINTINELRHVAGYDDIDGGDEVWRPSNEAPIADGGNDE